MHPVFLFHQVLDQAFSSIIGKSYEPYSLPLQNNMYLYLLTFANMLEEDINYHL